MEGKMSLFMGKIFSSILELLLFALIPFLWWLVFARKSLSFFHWLGLKPVEKGNRKKAFFWSLGTTIFFLLLSGYILRIVKDIEAVATSEFSGLGVRALPAIVVYAVCNTALPEELLFRGFLLKRIASKTGFVVGNCVQALLFGLLHGIMFFSYVGIVQVGAITFFTGCIAWFMGYVNEKKANGSILPSWAIHAIANLFSGICAAFF
jgi:membrane protease YdiL (CAAX protease family)